MNDCTCQWCDRPTDHLYTVDGAREMCRPCYEQARKDDEPIRRKLRVKRDANGRPIAEPAFSQPVPQSEVDDAIASIQTAVQNGAST